MFCDKGMVQFIWEEAEYYFTLLESRSEHQHIKGFENSIAKAVT